MNLIEIGIANLDPTVGALKSNTNLMIEMSQAMAKDRVTLGIFSEQTISGYPVEDNVQWEGFVSQQWAELKRYADTTSKAAFPSIFVVGVTVGIGGDLYNCAAVVTQGRILALYPKQKLPTYGIFYEERTFTPGLIPEKPHGIPMGKVILKFAFGKMAVLVCEDVWSANGPLMDYAYSGAEVVAIINASPFRSGVIDTRRQLIPTRAADHQVTLAYANQLGGNDSLVFDGGGFVNQCGKNLLEATRWKWNGGYETIVVDLGLTAKLRQENTTWRRDSMEYRKANAAIPVIETDCGPQAEHLKYKYPVPPNKSFFLPQDMLPANPLHAYFDDLMEAMVWGLRGYFEKTRAFDRIGIALSGGYDSSLALAVARIYAERKFSELSALSKAQKIKDFIHCFSLPTKVNKQETKSIAKNLAQRFGVYFKEVFIGEQIDDSRNFLDEAFGTGGFTSIFRQSHAARTRGEFMQNWSHAHNGLWIQTGNMSEKAQGYTTVGGDLMGAYSLMGNLPKSVEMELIRYLNRDHLFLKGAFDDLVLTRPSAELEEGQEDEKDLMPFPVLDNCFELFAGKKKMPMEVYQIVRETWSDDELKAMRSDYQPGMLKDWVIKFTKLFRASIFKWVIAPQSVHLGSLDLDRERALQLPVVQSPEWLMLEELEKIDK